MALFTLHHNYKRILFAHTLCAYMEKYKVIKFNKELVEMLSVVLCEQCEDKMELKKKYKQYAQEWVNSENPPIPKNTIIDVHNVDVFSLESIVCGGNMFQPLKNVKNIITENVSNLNINV